MEIRTTDYELYVYKPGWHAIVISNVYKANMVNRLLGMLYPMPVVNEDEPVFRFEDSMLQKVMKIVSPKSSVDYKP